MVMTRPPQFIAALLSGRSPGLRASCEHVCTATFPCSWAQWYKAAHLAYRCGGSTGIEL